MYNKDKRIDLKWTGLWNTMSDFLFTIDEMQIILGELMDELPKPFFEKLQGGVIIVDQVKYHPEAQNKDLYILGEYQRGNYGNMIRLYYGSFQRLYGNTSREFLKKRLRKTLRHEFRHHLENLAGERGLEIEDARFIRDYKLKNKEGSQ